MADVLVINNFELELLDLLKALGSGFEIKKAEIEIDVKQIKKFPAAMVFTSLLDPKPTNVLKIEPTTNIWLVVARRNSTKKDQHRRHDIYPLVLAVCQMVHARDFGEDYSEIKIGTIGEVANEDSIRNDYIIFNIPISYNFDMDAIEDNSSLLEKILNQYTMTSEEDGDVTVLEAETDLIE